MQAEITIQHSDKWNECFDKRFKRANKAINQVNLNVSLQSLQLN